MKQRITKWQQNISIKINSWTLKIVDWSIRNLSIIELKLNKNKIVNPAGYDDLTPTSRGDEDKKYSIALEWALKNENIKNIALTGAYGSGKSSIIKTFANNHRGYNILNISLASFTDSDLSDNKDINRLLELSILQQMFYHVKHNKIPDSRFKRIRNLKKKNVVLKSILLITWLLSCAIFFKVDFFTDFFFGSKYNLDDNNPIILISFIFIVLGVTYIASKAIRISNNSKLNKLNVQSGEIEISHEVDSSILNKHLDEILYFFEVTQFDIVVLEDLDRFNNTEIFTKLRELNILLNHSKQINKRIVFLYAIKDDMFQDKNRTKFFDFIIPVIPIINTSNSGDMLLRKFREAKFIDDNSKDSLSIDFISDISMYIDDMRLLKNIFNEYTMYRSKLDQKLNQNNLLSMIIYKNIFPSDFVNLHNAKGKVFSIFNKKSELVIERISKIKNEIAGLRKEIRNIEDVSLKSIEELRSIYIEAIIEKIPKAEAIQINNIEYSFKDLKNDEVFSTLVDCSNIKYKHSVLNTYYGQLNIVFDDSNISFKSIENQLDKENTYQEREDLILDRDNNKIEILKQDIEKLEKEKREIKSWSLSQIADKIEISSVFKEIENEKLIIYLIRNGYLNENYHDYISYFYEAFITKDDRDYLFSIKNREALDFNFKISKIENVIKRIKLKEFEYKEVLNCNLWDFLLVNRKKYDEQYSSLLSQICNKSHASLLFIDSFLDNGVNLDLFMKAICNKWLSFWSYIVSTDYSDEKKDAYLKLFLTYLNIEELKAQNIKNTLSIYISRKKDFLSFASDMDIDIIYLIIKELNIKFENLLQPAPECKIFKFVYQNNSYKINIHMIRLILTIKGNVENLKNIDDRNFTTIISSKCQNLIDYVNNNIQEYVSLVFLQLPDNTKESEYATLLLLNNSSITINDKRKIIDSFSNKVQTLSLVENIELKDYLLEVSKVVASWNNIGHYYTVTGNEINDTLSSFINNHDNYVLLSKSKIKDSLENNSSLVSNLSNSLITSNKITDTSFESLLLCCPYVYNPLDFAELSERKVELMIKHGYLLLSLERYVYIKENFTNLHIELIIRNYKKYLSSEEKYIFDKNDLLTLLASNVFSIQQKINIALTSDANIIINSPKLCSEICCYLLKLKYISLDDGLLAGIIKNAQPMENKLKLLNIHIEHLEENNISELLSCLGGSFADIAIKGKKPSIPLNTITLELVNKLSQINYISSYKEKDDSIKIYTKLQ